MTFDGSELDDVTNGEEPERDDELESEEEEAPENWPSLYIDGEAQALEPDAIEELERVQLEFTDASNGYQTEAQERKPLGWCNSAAITLDRSEDSVTVSISVGDPRGAFTFQIRRLPEDSTHPHAGKLLMHLPYPSEGMLHAPLTLDHEGTYLIG